MIALNRDIQNYDLVVIGGGPAGMAAALEARRAGLQDVLIVERQDQLGGILPQCIHNGFGSLIFHQDMPGPMYSERFTQQVAQTDIQVMTAAMVMDITPDRTIYLSSPVHGYTQLHARAVVLAMGCRERTRAQIRLPGSRPAGVFTAGTVQRLVNIDGYLPGREFVILGSGDIGMIMARRLTLEGARVQAVLELLPYLTGLRRNYVQCLQDFNIRLKLSTTVTNIIGHQRVQAVQTVQVDQHLQPIPHTAELINCDTFLLSVGLIPENELSLRMGVQLDPLTGGPLVDEHMATNIPGVFAAGNVVTIYDLVDFVSEAGAVAEEAAARFVQDPAPPPQDHLDLRPGPNVRSLAPQKITSRASTNDPITLNIRVNRLMEEHVVIDLLNPAGAPIKSFRQRYARPAEMLMVKLKRTDLPDRTTDALQVRVHTQTETAAQDQPTNQ